MTSTEFLTWIHYLDLDVNAFHREDYYMAQIAAEIRKGYVKDPSRIDLRDLLLEFVYKKNLVSTKKKDQAIQESKNFWLGSLGMEVPNE